MIGELVSVWIRVLTHPSVRTFDEEKSSANSQRTLTGVIIAAIVSGILAFVLTLVLAASLSGLTRGLGVAVPVSVGPIDAFRALVQSVVQTIAGFYIFCYVLQFAATKWFAGRGSFEEQAYLISTYFVPISVIAGVVNFIPCIGQLIAVVLGIYALVLTTFAVQSEQGLAVGNAVINWIVAAIITAVIMFILSLVSFGWL